MSMREEILSAALDLFEERGIAATSMRDVASACGLSKPAVYHYVESKDALIEAVYELVTADLAKRLLVEPTEGQSPRDDLIALVAAQVNYHYEHPKFIDVFWRERGAFSGAVKARVRVFELKYEARVEDIIERFVAERGRTNVDPHFATLTLLAMLSTVHRWVHLTDLPAAEFAENLITILLDGIGGA